MGDWAERKAVEQAVEQIAACSMVKKFYPTIIAKYSKVPLDKTYKYLLKFKEEGMLILKWEVRCDEYCCARTVETMASIPDDKKFIDCICGNEVELSIDNLFPVFEVATDYRENCIKGKKDCLCKKKDYLQLNPAELLREAQKEPASLRKLIPKVLFQSKDFDPTEVKMINIQINSNCTGVGSMSGNNYNFSGGNLSNKDGNIIIGDNNMANNNNMLSIPDGILSNLLTQINGLSVKEEQKKELKKAVSSITEETKVEKPNPFLIKSMMDSFTGMIKVVAQTPALIDAFGKWKNYVQHFIN